MMPQQHFSTVCPKELFPVMATTWTRTGLLTSAAISHLKLSIWVLQQEELDVKTQHCEVLSGQTFLRHHYYTPPPSSSPHMPSTGVLWGWLANAEWLARAGCGGDKLVWSKRGRRCLILMCGACGWCNWSGQSEDGMIPLPPLLHSPHRDTLISPALRPSARTAVQ